MSDLLTVLRCPPDKRAAKWIRTGEEGPVIDGYDAGAFFEVYELDVDGIEALAVRLELVSLDHRAFAIRGEPLPGIDRSRARRLLHAQEDGAPPTFREVPRRWLMLDFDGLAAPALFDPLDGEVVAYWLRAKLPAAFDGRSFWWQMTGSAGFRIGVRMRLAFWFDRPVGNAELGRWLKDAPVDHAVFRPVQPIYIARPLFDGVEDPVPVRSGLELDFHDVVDVPELPVEAPAATAGSLPQHRRHGAGAGPGRLPTRSSRTPRRRWHAPQRPAPIREVDPAGITPSTARR